MTYISSEQAHQSPLELYRFSLGGYFWRYTNADDNVVTMEGEEFYPEAISRTNISVSEEANSSAVTVTLPAWNQVAKYFTRTGAPARHIWLTILRIHRESGEVAQLFTGQVGSASFEGQTAKLDCQPLRASLQRRIPVQLVQSLCTNSLYDERCKANPALFSSTGTITAINGLWLTVSGITSRASDYFAGGYMYHAPTAQYATISAHTGPDQIKLLFNPGFIVGDTPTLYAGCDKRIATCNNKFGNVPNFQGFPFFPQIDPFKDGVD